MVNYIKKKLVPNLFALSNLRTTMCKDAQWTGDVNWHSHSLQSMVYATMSSLMAAECDTQMTVSPTGQAHKITSSALNPSSYMGRKS